MPDLLLEVLSEEIPALMQRDVTRQFERNFRSRLTDARLEFENSESFTTPRRLALLVHGLPAMQADIAVERKGPRVDAPDEAIQGFLKSTGLTLADCEQRETPKGPAWFAVMQEKGRPTGDLLADLLPSTLAAVSWPKSMRWDESGVRWVRPIRSILCLLDDEVVPFRFGSVESGRTTLGHRFLSSGPLTIDDVGGYAATLEDAKVLLARGARMSKIASAAAELAKGAGFSVVRDEQLLGENAGLVEWPVVLMGTIDERFMDLPSEVLRSAMSTHQRYFSLLDGSGRPAPSFVMVANTKTDDSAEAVRAGNERVLRARLADARFFWDQDRRRLLEENLTGLRGVIFHARLGTMADKSRRIEALARALCPAIPGANPDEAALAGTLCKADLVTDMVGEFPDLQGIMGSYYAREDGEEEAVYTAIREHYSPRGPDESCPTAPVCVAVALADKLDTLAGFFAIDKRPTGSKDPFALRRAALGVIRIIIENDLRLPLGDAFREAISGYSDLLPPEPGPGATSDALLAFFADRLRVWLRDRGYPHDHVEAVFTPDWNNDLARLHERVDALTVFLRWDDGANLLIAYRRAANILRIEEQKDGQHYEGEPDTSLFDRQEEHRLHKGIAAARKKVDAALSDEIFHEAMSIVAALREPVDAFFDHVTVNSDDPALRRNRLLMLSQIRTTLDRVADFSKIEG
ncbi:MAG: glycine--tRNA ligase subunit beta [Rhodospirillales bacterium]|nr:glycine--tRNA ligase subunit beta [Rhodospirillales bacterium]